jgi:hypothetical protein
MRDERMVRLRAEVVKIDKKDPTPSRFWDIIGGEGPIQRTNRRERESLGQGIANTVKFYTIDESTLVHFHPFLVHLQRISMKIASNQCEWLHSNMLHPRECHVIDYETEIYVWFKHATPKIRQKGVQLADDGRKESPLYVIKSFEEPWDFTIFFHGWDAEGRNPASKDEVEKVDVKVTGNLLESGHLVEAMKEIR